MPGGLPRRRPRTSKLLLNLGRMSPRRVADFEASNCNTQASARHAAFVVQLHGAADGDPAAGEHVRRDHGRLLLQQQRVGGNVARESRVGEDGLEGGGLARRDAVPG